MSVLTYAPPTTYVCGGIVDPKTQYEGYLSWVARMEKETMDKATGGDAFPGHGEPGMTIRDWYAGMVLQGLIAHSGIRTQKRMRRADARFVMDMADAMMTVREGSADDE